MSTQIPKIIHYIWLGNRSLDKVSIKCIDTWKKYLSDYKVKKWGDEECINIINSNIYAKQAYEAKKYAFVTDYLRLYILYHYGGVYMDTDVQIIKSINCFLNDEAFTCFEDAKRIPTALLAAKKGNKWIEMLLNYYENAQFINDNGEMDLTTNVDIITRLSKSWGFEENGKEQVLKSGVHIYTKEYFCPLDTSYERNNIFTENTYAVHLYNGSWRSPLRQRLSKIKKKLGINPDFFGKRIASLLRKI